jgi:hypothetical protein
MITLAEKISAAEACVVRIHGIVDGIDLCSNERTQASLSCLGIALDHHNAIVLCTKYRVVSSALFLVRALFENFLRGAWLAYIARDEQIKGFVAGKEPPKVYVLTEMLEKSDRFCGGALSKIKEERWRAMCAYAHTGHLAIQRYTTEKYVGPAHTDEEISEVLTFSNFFGILTAVTITEFVGDFKRTDALIRLFHEIFPADVEESAARRGI